jgi:hypothetical protein
MATASVRGQSASLLWRAGFVLLALLGVGLVISSRDTGARAAREESKADKSDLPPDLARVPVEGVALTCIRVGDIWNSDALKELRQKKEAAEVVQMLTAQLGVAPADIERLTVGVTDIRVDPLLFIATTKAYDRAKVLKAAFKDAKEEKVKDQVVFTGGKGKAIHFVNDRFYVMGTEREVIAWLQAPAPKKDGPLIGALRAAAGMHQLVAGVNPSAIPDEATREVPEDFKALLLATSAVLTVDVGKTVDAAMTVTFPDAEGAKNGQEAIKTGVTALRGFLEESSKALTKEGKENAKLVEFLTQIEAALKSAKLETKDTTLRAAVNLKIEPALLSVALAQAVAKVREAAARMESANNLKQLTLAIINYADTYNGQMPPAATFDKNGKPLLSWRVLILPFIEHEQLYKEFHLDEPWDSEHNKKLLEKMPKTYAPVGGVKTKEKYATFYQGFYGKDAAWEGTKGLRFPADFPDGTSNTILLVEAAKPVPWSKPEDIPFDKGKLWPKVGGQFKSGFNAALCDGSVRFLTRKLSEETFRAAITRNGAEVLGDDW